MLSRVIILISFLLIPLVSFSQFTIGKTTVNYYQDLKMDIYDPQMSGEKPVLLYVHGGGFSGGSRDSQDIVKFAEKVAAEGFMVVSISYRLTMKGVGFGCDVPANDKIQTFASAALDAARATAYLLENAGKLGIDPEQIVICGSSAGAETVLHLAYWDDASTFDGNPVLPAGFRYAGVISFAGALIDDQLITPENAIPTFLVHGTCDNLVPYDYAPHHYCDKGSPGYLMLHGAASISKRLAYLGKPYYLITVCGGDHAWAGKPMEEMTNEIVEFLKLDVTGNLNRQESRWIKGTHSCDYPESNLCNG